MKDSTLRLFLVDDQQLMRQGLRTLLEMEGMAVVGEAADGAAAVEGFEKLQPDVVLMDIRMPNMDGVEATRRIRSRFPEAKILVLTTFDQDELVFDALRAGASGYLLKDVSRADLAAAVRSVAGGGAALEPTVARRVIDAFARLSPLSPASASGLKEPLSGREQAVLRLLAQGLSNKEIARQLFLAEGTVKNHVSTILQKIDARDRTQAALKARELGLIET